MSSVQYIKETSMSLYCCMYADCDSQYSTKYNLQRHVESIHMHVKRYQCKVCSVYFSSRQSLKEHLHIHSGVMPFICNTCGKSFRQASQLSIHLRLHKVEGKDSGFSKLNIDEELGNIKPIDICMTVDKSKFILPCIATLGSQKSPLAQLPNLFRPANPVL